MLRKLNSKAGAKRGFTLIELLVVVLILAILMAVALPAYLSAVADSERKTCRANMQTISNAVQAAKVRTRSAAYFNGNVDGASLTTLSDLQAVPKCPAAGSYSVSAGTPFTVHCSVAAHDSGGAAGEPAGFTPGTNSQ